MSTAATQAATLLEAARALAPRLIARADAAEEARSVPAETIADLADARFFDILKPARFGGLECHPGVFFDVVAEVASACPSTGWVLGVVAAHAWQLALFPEAAQTDVWGADRSALICSSYMPVGKLTPEPGGFRVSGRWGFSSGCDHCSWAMLGAMAPPAREGAPPDMLTLLVPRSDLTIDDDWFVAGLRATGSKSVVLDGAFVPTHRTHRMSDAFRLDSPGNAVNPAPLYRLPFGQVFTRTVATPAIGMLQGALDAFVAANRGRASRADGKLPESDPAAQEAVANAKLALCEVRAVLHHDFDEMMGLAERGEPISLASRVGYRHHSASVTDRMVAAVDALFVEAGSGAIFRSSRLQRFFQDVHAARAHHANNPRRAARNVGSTSFGHPTSDYFL